MPQTTNYEVLGTDVGTGNIYVLKTFMQDAFPAFNAWNAPAGLWLFGHNTSGQLGDSTSADKSSPVQNVAGGTTWKQVAAGGYSTVAHSAAIRSDGLLLLWGGNANGQLGDNTSTAKSSPVQTIAGGSTWKQIACGGKHTSAVKTDGTLWAWGLNTNGQLGDATVTSKSSPVQTTAGGTAWKQVSCGAYHTAAVKTDGTLWCWGLNTSGQLGDGTTANKSSPVQTVAGGSTWKQVSCGWFHTLAIKTDGTLWAWGINGNGQLGDGTSANKSSPVQTVAGGTSWIRVAGGGQHTLASKTDGTLWTWGLNTNGQLGDGTATSKSSPVQTVAGGTTWKNISAGAYHSVALDMGGELWTWGLNTNGQLGDNTVTKRSSPVQTVAGGTMWMQVVGGSYHTEAIYAVDDN